jgi:hypothetical protein
MRRLPKTIAIVVSLLVACLDERAVADNLFVIIATDDDAPTIGKDMQKNSKLVTSLVKRNVPAGRSQVVKVPGQSLTPRLLLHSIESLPAGADDLILLYYSGHGAYDEQRQQTFLLMSRSPGNGLFADQIQSAVQAKGVRFSATVLDCCNTVRPLLARGPIAPGEPPDAGPARVSALFQRLFFDSNGSVVIESSAPREYAITVPALHYRDPRRGVIAYHFGSLFTRSFTGVLQNWEEADGPPPDWMRICRETQGSMDDEFPEICPGGVIKLGPAGVEVRQARQTVTALINGQPFNSR